MKKVLLLPCFATLLFSLNSCEESAPAVGNGAAAKEVMQADYVVIRPTPVANEINLTGTLMPAESAMLGAQTAGLVKEIHFEEGQWVRQGQLLLQLDDRQWQAQGRKLEAQLKTARTDLARKKQLLDIQGISQTAVDEAALAVASLEADLEELNVRIDYATIRAPFNGLVGLRSVSPGSYLSAGDPVARLVQTNPLKLEFNVPERYADQVRGGQRVRFTLAENDETYAATVYATEAAISESTRALRIRARVPNEGGKLIAGAFAEVNLTLDSIPNALLVPTEAVVPQLNDQVVYQISQGMIREVKVEPGIRLPRHVQIESGLDAGDTIMVSGLLQARDGLPVAPAAEISVELIQN